MKNPKQAGIVLCLMALFPSCATVSSITDSGTAKKYEALMASPEFQSEKALFKSRMGGKSLCPEKSVSDLIAANDSMPSKDCLYPAGKLLVEKGDAFNGPDLKQRTSSIKVIQVGPNGFIVHAQYYVLYGRQWSETSSDRAAFIHKTDQEGMVDGSYLDPVSDLSLYEYMGIFQYQRAIGGSNTVHSFRKVPLKELADAKKGLKVYGAFKEFFIENKLWDWVERIEQQQGH